MKYVTILGILISIIAIFSLISAFIDSPKLLEDYILVGLGLLFSTVAGISLIIHYYKEYIS